MDNQEGRSMPFDEYRRPGGIFLWFSHRFSGLFLLGMLLAHFYFLHYYQEGFVTYEKVVPRLASNSWKIFDIAFLIFAVFHGTHGLWTVVLEYVHKEKTQRLLFFVLITMGLLFLGIGAFSIASFKVLT
jgi:succinate dehydrogenase / fumarate reductase membrane anchor subunit